MAPTVPGGSRLRVLASGLQHSTLDWPEVPHAGTGQLRRLAQEWFRTAPAGAVGFGWVLCECRGVLATLR